MADLFFALSYVIGYLVVGFIVSICMAALWGRSAHKKHQKRVEDNQDNTHYRKYELDRMREDELRDIVKVSRLVVFLWPIFFLAGLFFLLDDLYKSLLDKIIGKN